MRIPTVLVVPPRDGPRTVPGLGPVPDRPHRRRTAVKFTVERDVLSEAVAWAARSLPVRPSVPVLAGLLIETTDEGDGLVLSTFDYETSARASIPASVQD